MNWPCNSFRPDLTASAPSLLAHSICRDSSVWQWDWRAEMSWNEHLNIFISRIFCLHWGTTIPGIFSKYKRSNYYLSSGIGDRSIAQLSISRISFSGRSWIPFKEDNFKKLFNLILFVAGYCFSISKDSSASEAGIFVSFIYSVPDAVNLFWTILLLMCANS